jgi:hypothetical protein
LGLAALFVTPSQKNTDGKANQAVDEEPYIDERKLSSTTAKGDLTNSPSPKKQMEMATKLLMTNHSSTRGSHQAHRL